MSEARRLALMVHRDPCGGVRQYELERRVGLPNRQFKAALFIAYRKGWIDFIRGHVVAADPRWNPNWKPGDYA